MTLPIPHAYRDPDSLHAYDVCSKCQRELTRHRWTSPDGHLLETLHCPVHGDVAPMRSHIVNAPDWSAA